MERDRDTFGAIVTNKTNPHWKEILIVKADSDNQARGLIQSCAEKLGWLAEANVYPVMECPPQGAANDEKPTMLRTPTASDVKASISKLDPKKH